MKSKWCCPSLKIGKINNLKKEVLCIKTLKSIFALGIVYIFIKKVFKMEIALTVSIAGKNYLNLI